MESIHWIDDCSRFSTYCTKHFLFLLLFLKVLMKLHSGFIASANTGSAVLCKFTSDMLSVCSWKSF